MARVLVADDNPARRDARLAVLVRAGFHTAAARSADETLQQVQRFAPDLILVQRGDSGSLGPRILGLYARVPALRRSKLLAFQDPEATLDEGAQGPPGVPDGVLLLPEPEGAAELVESVRRQLGPEQVAPFLVDLDGGGEVEDVDVDDDVSAADLSGEALLPTGDVAVSTGEVALSTGEVPLPGLRAQDADQEPDHTGPVAPGLLADDVLLMGQPGPVPLLDVIALLARQQQTGVLRVQADARRFEATFQRGRLSLCTATGVPELRLGRFAREIGTLTPEEIDELSAMPPREKFPHLLGQRLVEVGHLSRDELREALARQSQELLYELLGLKSGRFFFTRPPALPPLAVEHGAPLELDVEVLLLEGYRRIRDFHLLEEEIAEGTVYLPVEERGRVLEIAGLTREESAVLSLCTGRHNLKDIARESGLLPLEVARILHRLQAVRLVRRRLPPLSV